MEEFLNISKGTKKPKSAIDDGHDSKDLGTFFFLEDSKTQACYDRNELKLKVEQINVKSNSSIVSCIPIQ